MAYDKPRHPVATGYKVDGTVLCLRCGQLGFPELAGSDDLAVLEGSGWTCGACGKSF